MFNKVLILTTIFLSFLTYANEAKHIISTENRLIEFESYTENNNYKKARQAYAEIISKNISSNDLHRIEKIYKQIPEDERPIRTYNFNRTTIDEINRTFGTNIDEFTKSEYITFLSDFANRNEIRSYSGDKTYVWRLMDHIGVPVAKQIDILIQTVKTRYSLFKEVARLKRGLYLRDWPDETEESYITRNAMRWLENDIENNIEGNTKMKERAWAFVDEVKAKILNEKDEHLGSYLRSRFLVRKP